MGTVCACVFVVCTCDFGQGISTSVSSVIAAPAEGVKVVANANANICDSSALIKQLSEQRVAAFQETLCRGGGGDTQVIN